jgi:hypothetical protein
VFFAMSAQAHENKEFDVLQSAKERIKSAEAIDFKCVAAR